MCKKSSFLRFLPFFVCLLTLFACGSVTAFAQADNEQTEKAVYLFSKSSFEGEKEAFDVGEYPEISFRSKSIRIPAEYEVKAYTGKNYSGREYVLQYDREKFFSAHMGKGDFNFIIGWDYIPCIRSMKVSIIESDPVDITNLDDEGWSSLMAKYAPRMYMAKGEKYGATSIDNVFENMDRIKSESGYYTLQLKDGLTKDNPFEQKEFFFGNNESSVVYGFKIEKEGGYIDFSYFQLCPFDTGKFIGILQHNIGSHICDWEHVTLRFLVFEENGKQFIRPVKAAFNVHSGLVSYESWKDVEKVDDTHFQVYVAAGSHGIYAYEGDHHYVDFGPIQKLTDSCSKGEAIDLWEDGKLETFEYTPAMKDDETAVCCAMNGSKWAGCFVDVKDDDDGVSVRRWGESPVVTLIHGNSPSGPQGKNEINSNKTFS